MKFCRILTLAWVLLLFTVGQAKGNDTGRCTAQPNELAVDLCMYMRLEMPTPEAEPDDTGPAPSLVSKLKGLPSALSKGKVGEWMTGNPTRVTTVPQTPPHTGNTQQGYGTVVLWSFGGGPMPLEDRLEAAWPPDGYRVYAWKKEARRGSDEFVRDAEQRGIPEGPLELE